MNFLVSAAILLCFGAAIVFFLCGISSIARARQTNDGRQRRYKTVEGLISLLSVISIASLGTFGGLAPSIEDPALLDRVSFGAGLGIILPFVAMFAVIFIAYRHTIR